MTAPLSFRPICYICNKPVKLQLATVDELGRAVHGGCYFLKIIAKPASFPMPRPKP